MNIGKSFTSNAATFYIGGLQGTSDENQKYKYSVSDKFNTNFIENDSIQLTAYTDSYTQYPYLVADSTKIYPYHDHENGPYNVLYVEPQPYTSVYSTTYVSSGDSINKYFLLYWHFSDEAAVISNYRPIEYKTIKDTDTQKRFYITLPDGMNFKNITDGSRQIVVRQYINPDVIARDGCSTATENRKVGDGKKYAPIPIVKSENYKFEAYFDFEECTNALRFPLSLPSVYELIITPLNYGLYKKTNDVVADVPAETGVYYYGQSERYNKHYVEPGIYVIKYEDKLGNIWEEEIELEYSAPPVMSNIIANDAELVLRTENIPADYKTDDDIGTLITKSYNFTGEGAGADLVMRFEEVPNAFYFPQGHEVAVPALTTEVVINKEGTKYYQLVPGRYKISFTPECGQPYVDEFIIDAAGVEDFDYKLVNDCEGVKIHINSARIRLPQANADGTSRYVDYPLFCVYRIKSASDGNGNSSGFPGTGFPTSVNYRNLTSEGGDSNVIPYSDFDPITVQGVPIPIQVYKLTVHFVSQKPAILMGALDHCHFIRPVEIDFQNMAVQRYYPLYFDYSKSSGYMCGNDAKITAMALQGDAPYTYTLYETSSDMVLPADSDIPLDVITGGENEVVVFTVNDPAATSKYYWVKVEDGSSCGVEKYQSVKVYNLAGNLAIQKTEELCDGEELTLTAVYVDGSTYNWYKGGTVSGATVIGGELLTEYSGIGKNTFTVSNANGEDQGMYHVQILEDASGCGINTVHSAEVNFVPLVMVWDPQSGSVGWSDENNWYPKNQGLPKECTDVYIPGNSTTFPALVEGESNTCRDIYFMPGAQLGQPQLLNYRYAHVELDFGTGVLGSVQDKSVTKEDLIATGRDSITSAQRVRFGAATSGATLTRDIWNMFSMPLGDVATGDFAFGGFPFSYIKKFDPVNGEESFISGKWADYSNETTLKFSPGQGFGHFYYDYSPSPYYSMDHSSQWEGVKSANKLIAPTPESISGSGVEFGLAQTNGILHLPYFADEELSNSHRSHTYSGVETSGTSSFYFYRQAPRTAADFLQWTGGSSNTYRSSAAYRFIPEQVTFVENNLDFTYNAGTFEAGDIVLIGNPYMSALDFDAFVAANSGSVKSGYQLFNGTDGYEVYFNNSNPMIAPLQSVLVEAAADGDLNLVFTAQSMAKTDPSIKLKTTKGAKPAEQNKITIRAINSYGEVETIIRQSEYARDGFCEEDFSKIIAMPVMGYRPEVYTLANKDNGGKKALSVNTIQSYDIIIPVGIITAYTGNIKLEFTGMDNYGADIIFIDVEAEKPEINITGKDMFSYNFNYTPVIHSDGSAVATEDRFMIRISPKTTTGLDDRANDNIVSYVKNDDLIVSSSSGNLIKAIELYDVQGRLIFTEMNIQNAFYKAEGVLNTNGIYIVKICTEKETKEVKVIR